MTENHADTAPDVMERFLDEIVGTVDRRTVTGDEAAVYGQTVVGALDAYLSLTDPADTRLHHDIGETKPDTESRTTDLYTIRNPRTAPASGHDSELFAREAFIRKVNQLRNQFVLLFDAYDTVTLSGETGLPLYNEVRQVERDREDIDAELEDIGDEYERWARDADARGSIPPREDWDDRYRTIEGTTEWEKNLLEDLTISSLHEGKTEDDITWPDKLAENARQLDYFRKLDTITPVERADHDLAVHGWSKGGAASFTVTISDFSTVSDDRFLYYEIDAAQEPEEDKRFLSMLDKKPPVHEKDDGHRVSDLFEDAIKDTVGFTPEQVSENWDALDEVYDVPHGDRIHPEDVALWKVGPMYTADNAPLPTGDAITAAFEEHVHGDVDAIVADSQYDTFFELQEAYSEELRDRDPRRYCSMQVGQFLDDNPDEFVFIVEKEWYRDQGADTGHELVLASSDAETLTDYMPDAFDGQETDITTWVIGVPDTTPGYTEETTR